MILFGSKLIAPTYQRVEWLFLRLLAAVYLTAFLSMKAQVWLTAFGSPHLLCLQTFGAQHGQTLAEPYRLFMQMVEAISPVLKAIIVRLDELAASK